MGTQAKRRDVAKERFWREVAWRQAKSGKSVRAFRGDEELAESGFYFWWTELRRRRQERAAARARKARTDEATASAFVPVTVAGPPAMMETGQARIELALPSGAVLWLPRDGEVSAMVAPVAELERRLC